MIVSACGRFGLPFLPQVNRGAMATLHLQLPHPRREPKYQQLLATCQGPLAHRRREARLQAVSAALLAGPPSLAHHVSICIRAVPSRQAIQQMSHARFSVREEF